MPDTSSNHIYNFYANSNSHNIEQIGDTARVLQGQVIEVPNMTSSNNLRTQRNFESDGNIDYQAEGTMMPNQHASYAVELQQRLELLEREAVTSQVNANEPHESHYGDNDRYNFDAGDVCRVWHPTNTEVHLGTFLVLFQAGTSMTCLRIVCEPETVDYKFISEHGRVRIEYDKLGTARRSTRRQRTKLQDEDDSESYLLHLRHDQRMVDNCWIDILNPWNINWRKEYRFANCGRMEKESFTRLRSEHLELYAERASGSTSGN